MKNNINNELIDNEDDFMDELMNMMETPLEGLDDSDDLDNLDNEWAAADPIMSMPILNEPIINTQEEAPLMNESSFTESSESSFSESDAEDDLEYTFDSLLNPPIMFTDDESIEDETPYEESIEHRDVVDEAPISEPSVVVISSESEMLAQMSEAQDDFDSFGSLMDDLELHDEGSDLEVSLEKPGMDTLVVTPDGRTLSEILPNLRGGNRAIDDVVNSLRDETRAVDIAGKRRSDLRYVKHVVDENEKNANDKERKYMSNKFIQKHRKYTEQEKVIMRNLGVNSEQFAKMVHADRVDQSTREKVLAAGVMGNERYFKGRRFRTTVGDMAILDYLAKFKFANTRVMRWISDEAQSKTSRKLNRLRENGLVTSMSIVGIPDLWGSTKAGLAVSGYDLPPALARPPKMASISGTIGVNYLAACLWFNKVNVLNLDDFPAMNRKIPLTHDGRTRALGEELVSELEIRSNLGKEINPQSTTMKTRGNRKLYDIIGEDVRKQFAQWRDDGMTYDSPEMLIGNERMWVLYPDSSFTSEYHVPDLVVKRDRGPNGEPKSIAVELERYAKTNNSYKKILMAYKLDKTLYERVIWVTPDSRVERMLRQAAEEIGFENYDVVPIITKDGIHTDKDIWMI